MIIGVVKEIKDNENRVALTPSGVAALRQSGHQILVEQGAGSGSGFSDNSYRMAGAEVMEQKGRIFAQSELIIKVKEPLPPEYDLLREGHILFTYLHLAAEPALTRVLQEKKVAAIAYETIRGEQNTLPLLTPMSEVAGRMSIQVGARLLEKQNGGKGILLGGVPGVEPAQVVILGGGTVGINAAKMAVGLEARVTVIDRDAQRLRYLDDIFAGRVTTVMSNAYNIAHWTEKADLLVGAVLLPGAKAPQLVSEEMVKRMTPGSVIVDVAIDQGGCVATIDHVTTHNQPTFIKHGVVHYAVANMPGAVARTSTIALTNATLEYAVQLANKGFIRAIRENRGLASGVNVLAGKVTCSGVSEALGIPCTPLADVLGEKQIVE